MNHYGGKQLAASFRTVRANTIKIAEDIPEDKYGFKASPDTKPVGQLLAHIAVGNRFQDQAQRVLKLNKVEGFDFPALMQSISAEENKPRTKAQIIEMLTKEGDAWASFLEGLSDEFLAEPVTMFPGTQPATKSRLEMLLSPKEHEMHHRGQLMMIQRMVGVTPHLTRQQQERMAAAAAAR